MGKNNRQQADLHEILPHENVHGLPERMYNAVQTMKSNEFFTPRAIQYIQ